MVGGEHHVLDRRSRNRFWRLALALTSELPEVEVWGTDVSDDALAVAANLAGTGLASTASASPAACGSRAPGSTARRLRLVVSNPPYVAESELAELPRSCSTSRGTPW